MSTAVRSPVVSHRSAAEQSSTVHRHRKRSAGVEKAGHVSAAGWMPAERFAAMFLPNQEPIGQRIRLSRGPTSSQDTDTRLTVVGVAPSVRQQPTL